MGSHAAGGLGQTSHLAGSLTGAGGEEVVHFFQLVAGVLGQEAHDRSDPVLAVVVLKEVENLLMVFVQIGNPFGFLHVLQPFRAPLIELEQEAVFINFEGFTLVGDFCLVCVLLGQFM